MTKFIPVNCIRDFSLSAGIMQNISQIIEIENSTRGLDMHHYIDVAKDGIVTRCAMILIEGACATVLYTHDMNLSDCEALVRSEFPEATHVQCFSTNPKDRPVGWMLVSANFKSRISVPTKGYRFEDTGNPPIKMCYLSTGSTLCSIVGNHMAIALRDEAIDRTTQKTVDMLAGVAVSEGQGFMVQCLSDDWSQAFDDNPNYVFRNATVAKQLR
ncbi:hypothetical protein BIZ78_gp003 [Erwinia phage vB_EamM_Caitlin]|uniref:hypothetical protein n=1 Tax=Erwinia phage vB_EamM_Caitlin TaxID=1883379 RepID=UPI00081D0C76|nr:hypothetical protein BIZ78_gp003 [Erwinia phage vB_EamM_Caitlin]ANZ48572.1 hypothetical protein CAITLIN_277 [Erwinia phage vB_EamM_Caitlin]